MTKRVSFLALGAAAALLLILILINTSYQSLFGSFYVPLYDSVMGKVEAFGTISWITMPLTGVLAVIIGLMGFKLINEKLAYSIIAVMFTYGFICALYTYVNDNDIMGSCIAFHIQSLSLMLSQLMPVILCFIGFKKITLKGAGGVLLCLVPAVSFLTFFISSLEPWYQAYIIDSNDPENVGLWDSFFDYYCTDYLQDNYLIQCIKTIHTPLSIRAIGSGVFCNFSLRKNIPMKTQIMNQSQIGSIILIRT